EFIGRSHKFINNVASSMTKQVTVSYSGGKDSLVVLQLVSECLEDFDILFADTGIEFPETVSNTQEVSQLYGKPLRSISSGNAFWESVDSFGPPSVEMRWCCKVCKLGPITQLIEGNYEEGCLTFIGQRKYESDTRAKSERVWKNPWVGNQIGAAPIQDWTAMHVWLYIFMHGLPYNPLYKKGFDRIGCWLCPSCSVADLHRLRATHPEFASKLENYLLGYAQRSGLSPEWVEHGMWRWKKLPPRLQEIAKAKGILTTPKVEINGKFEFTVT
ncbi:MAG TPA: phosphoadenosine phosphosulfate reductase family protein, partial [Methanomethylovorans sp.]|nr:phosphoadenosine phosphosulfate reductase family protein [Methanomethylovorans sp.]